MDYKSAQGFQAFLWSESDLTDLYEYLTKYGMAADKAQRTIEMLRKNNNDYLEKLKLQSTDL